MSTPAAADSPASPRPSARIVAIANGSYHALQELTQAVPDARALSELLAQRHGFTPLLLTDLERGALLDAIDLQLSRADAHPGALILSWTGHGRVGDDGSLRLQGRSNDRDVDVAAAGDLGEWAARTGARQVLVLIDTCFAGRGLIDAARLATAVDAGRRVPGQTWFGVLAASLGDEPARSGALSRILQRLLTQGPRVPDIRWHPSRPYICGDELVQALLAEWDEPRQTPYPISAGRAWELVCNPLYQPDLPDLPVEDLLHSVRGGSGDERFFTGRESALTQLVAWLARARSGLLVVTGPPGCGKSALVGRLASLSSPLERERLLHAEAVPAALDPGVHSIDAQLQARGATVDTAAEELARQLHLDPAEGVFGVLGEARKRRLAGRPLAIVVDGLDEARQMSQQLGTELLLPLAREARVIVATRDLPIENTSLLALLGGAQERVDLGEDAAGTLRDVRRYILRRLADVAPAMDPERVADEIAHADARPAASAPFLLARLITSQLRDAPVDTSAPDWRLKLASTVENALERDLSDVVLEVDGKPQPAAARELLRALAAAHGSGFPADDVWPAVATALSASGAVYGRDAVYLALTALGRHVIASSEDRQPVYRIAHRRLADYLVGMPRASADPAGRSTEVAIADAVANSYEQWLDDGHAPDAHAYLWRFGWRHLADAGAPGLRRLERLVERDRGAFLADLAAACDVAGTLATNAVRPREALEFHEQAVKARRELGDARRLALSLFQLSLAHTLAGDEDSAEHVADEATELARALPEDAPGREILAAALLTKAIALVRDGRYKTAQRLAEESIALGAAAAEGDDDEALTRQISAYSTASRAALLSGDADAAERYGRRAVEIADAHDSETTAPLVFLETCSNLAYLLAGGAMRSVQPAEPSAAVDTASGQRVLDAYRRSGPRGDLGDLLMAKGLLALARARSVNLLRGATDQAVIDAVPGLIDDAIALMRPNAAEVVDYAVLFAEALLMRAALLAQGDPQRAIDGLQEAIATLRRFPAGNTLIGTVLAQTLDTVTAIHFAALVSGALAGLPEAIERQEEAVALLRPTEGWGQRLAFAGALGRLAALLAVVGNERDAQVRGEAIETLRELGSTAPAVRLQLLSNLADQAGRLMDRRTGEAAELAREALQLAEGMAANPALTLLVAQAELNLGNSQFLLGTAEGAAALLGSAIERLQALRGTPMADGLLANAHAGLSQRAAGEGDFVRALKHARDAAAMFDAASSLPLVASTGWVIQLALGRALRGAGHIDEGTHTLQEVVDGLRVKAPTDATSLGALAVVLNTGAADLWDATLAALQPHPVARQHLALQRRRPASEIGLTVQLLLDALALDEPAELRNVRQAARTYRSIDPENFDRAWQERAGALPDWIAVDAAIEWAAIGWWNVPTWVLARDYLRAHPELLDPQTDIVLEEFASEAERREMTDRYLQLLAAARRDGVDAAFAPLLLEIEIGEWLRSDDPQEHLLQHADLLRTEVLDRLKVWSAAGDATARLFAAIHALARRGEQDLALLARDKPATMDSRLRAAWRAKDAARLEALATIVLCASQDEAVGLQAAIAVLIAEALQQRELDGSAELRRLRDRLHDADPAQRAALAEVITDAIAHHPELAAQLVMLQELTAQ